MDKLILQKDGWEKPIPIPIPTPDADEDVEYGHKYLKSKIRETIL